MKLKKLLLVVIVFILGFFTHALFFPDLFANGIMLSSDALFSNVKTASSASNQQAEAEKHVVLVTYDGTSFSRTNVTVPLSDYIVIRNESQDTQLWLAADMPELATSRGYAYKEEVRVRLDKKAQIHVLNKLNPQARLIITVK